MAVVDPDRKMASGASDCTLCVWNIPGGDARLTMESSGLVSGVVFGPDDRALLCAIGNHGVVERWDIRTGKQRGFLSVRRSKMSMETLALSPDGRWLLSGYGDGFV